MAAVLYMSRLLRLAPLVLFGLVLAGLVWRLAVPADTNVESRLTGQSVPEFETPALIEGKSGLSSADLRGRGPRLVNVFASWCVPCIAEAQLLGELKEKGVAIDGIAIRDRPEDVARFLAEHGDPFERIGDDPQSRVQIAFGSSGVPESFIVDGKGIIRYQHIGPIEADDMATILSRLKAAR
ncbi:MAG: DsbE family thiol:disulfide interchange protein [Sphingomicrobium sp.]